MPELKEVIDAPAFYELPRGEQFKALRSFPEFSGMPLREQGTFLSIIQQQHAGSYGAGETAAPAEAKPGFFETLGSRVGGGIKSMFSDPVKAAFGMGLEGAEQVKRGVQQIRSGETLEGAGRVAGGLIPVAGPEAIKAGEEFGEGKPAAGAADALLALAPFLREPLAKAGGKIQAMTEPLPGAARTLKTTKPSLASRATGAAAGIKIPTAVKFMLGRIPGGRLAVQILESLQPQEIADAAQKYQEEHGKLPETWNERVDATNEYDAYKKAKRKALEPPKTDKPKPKLAERAPSVKAGSGKPPEPAVKEPTQHEPVRPKPSIKERLRYGGKSPEGYQGSGYKNPPSSRYAKLKAKFTADPQQDAGKPEGEEAAPAPKTTKDKIEAGRAKDAKEFGYPKGSEADLRKQLFANHDKELVRETSRKRYGKSIKDMHKGELLDLVEHLAVKKPSPGMPTQGDHGN